jgi:DNA-directed RNA polymerase specialized sigma24 family protein
LGYFERLYRKDGELLWRAVLAYTGDRESANGAVVAAFAWALSEAHATRRTSVRLWRTAFRVADAALVERSKYAGIEPPEGMDAVLDEGAAHDTSGLLIMGLRRLGAVQRGALVLRYYARRSMWSAATVMRSSWAMMPIRLVRGRRRLRRLLGDTNAVLKERFGTLDRIPAPDLWPEIERGARP